MSWFICVICATCVPPHTTGQGQGHGPRAHGRPINRSSWNKGVPKGATGDAPTPPNKRKVVSAFPLGASPTSGPSQVSGPTRHWLGATPAAVAEPGRPESIGDGMGGAAPLALGRYL